MRIIRRIMINCIEIAILDTNWKARYLMINYFLIRTISKWIRDYKIRLACLISDIDYASEYQKN